jgi:glycosyltransferase involved in cell wall biosynthesis
VKRVLGDQVLRERLRRAGLDRVGAFSWDRAAQQTVAVYDGLR